MSNQKSGSVTIRSRIIKTCNLVLAASLIALALACDGDRVSPACPDEERDYFPNNLGDQWIYATFDSLSMTADTVLVRVAGRIIRDDREVAVWEYHSITGIDTEYVYITQDTVRMYRHPDFPITTLFVIPFAIGNEWAGDYVSETYEVLREEPLVVPAASFSRAILIEKRWGAFNDYGRIHTWYQPDIGVLKKHHVGWSFGTANVVWELIGWDVAD